MEKTNDQKFCSECGKIIRAKAEICPLCGVRQNTPNPLVFNGTPGEKRCLTCGYQGKMKTWLGSDNLAQLIAIVLLLFYVVPGIIFIVYFWGKSKCPQCGAIGKTVPK